jgi:hypothetical protein
MKKGSIIKFEGYSLNIIDCIFTSITSEEIENSENGTIIFTNIPSGKSFLIENCKFSKYELLSNEGYRGSIYAYGEGTLEIKNCSFSSGYATLGGTFYIETVYITFFFDISLFFNYYFIFFFFFCCCRLLS